MLTALEQARTAMLEGRFEDALCLYEAALAQSVRDGTAADATDILRRIGTVHQMRGDLDVAFDVLEVSRAVAELNGLDHLHASALIGLAAVHQYQGELEQAERLNIRARVLAEGIGEERLAAGAEQNLGTLANIRGDIAGALARYGASLVIFRRLGDELTAARTLNNMGMAHVDLREWASAEWCFDEAFELADRLRDMQMIANISLSRAELYLKRGAFDRAREACDLAFEVSGRLGSDRLTGEAHKLYGVLYRETAKPHLAETHLGLAVGLAQTCRAPLLEAEVESERAVLFLHAEQNPEALRCLNRAHRIFSDLQARRDVADIVGRLDDLEATFLQVTRAWAESIEAKDAYTVGHCQRVADYACMLAEALGITGRELAWFRMGAFLHDVGKIKVSSEILNKPGKLSEDEWLAMRNHTVAGHEIVASLDFPWDVGPLVRSHHEHWVGTGYPDGLAGEAIPLYARILCVADVYDALTTTRSYRPALSREEALRIMERDVGRIFDPELFPIFRRLTDTPPVLRVPQQVAGGDPMGPGRYAVA